MKDLLAEGTRIRHFGPLRNACETEYMVAARNLPSHLNLLEANGYCVSVAPNANPTTLVLSYGTGKVADERLGEIVRECFDLRPSAIIRTLNLRRPIYQQVAAYGHFGRPELDLPWEKVERVQELLAKA